MKDGLYLFQIPSGYARAVLRIAWLRQVDAEEVEAYNQLTVFRTEYGTTFEQAEAGLPEKWSVKTPLKGIVPHLRIQVQDPHPLSVKGYAKLCPRPDWALPENDLLP